RLAVLIAGCACTAHPAGRDATVPALYDQPAAIAPDAAVDVPPEPIRRAVHAMPAGNLAIVALTADGRAAATADNQGAIRWWPSLDGDLEPVVVAAPPPRMIAIARDGGGFSIAMVDSAGALTLARLTADGDQLRSVVPAGDQPVLALAGAPDGFY